MGVLLHKYSIYIDTPLEKFSHSIAEKDIIHWKTF
jgi:hypothetical protein